MAMQYHLTPPMQHTMGGANPHTPQSVFQHMMGQQNAPQQAGPWLQMPQVRTLSMPWSVTTYQQPDLIRFTGERNQTIQGTMLHLKRKLDTPDIADTRQAKQFISEEKMASHFQELHISSNSYKHNSSNYTATVLQQQPACDNSQYTSLNLKSNEPVDIDQNEYSQPRLIISEELKLLKEEPLIPATLLSKLERPSMALVLWEPPSKHLALVLPTPRNTQSTIENSLDDSNNNNNNNVSNHNNNNRNSNNNIGIADLNESSVQLLEPMEL